MSFILLLLSGVAQAGYEGEWREVHTEKYLYISKTNFIFRKTCGRYTIIKRSGSQITLFTGRDVEEENCLGRGEHVCMLHREGHELTVNCGDFQKDYTQE